jgi:hypothetical protein
MSDAPSFRLPFGTVAAIFPSPQVAEAAVAALVQRGYPRELISVLTGRPWQDGASEQTGLAPDPELRFQLLPASPVDAARPANGAIAPPLAAFSGSLLTETGKRRNPALWPLICLGLGIVATLIALYSRNWEAVVITSLVALHVVVFAAVLAYVRGRDVTFPFRERIPDVDRALEHGGALVTVRCTMPYVATVEALLREGGGEVLGYADETIYPVPA